MSLPDGYLSYDKRGYGQDMDRYAWRLLKDHTPKPWPGGEPVAAFIVIPVEWHPLNPSGKPFKHPGAMQTPYPDLRHFTVRDYGARVGAFRLLDALKASDAKATFPVSAALLDRCAPLIEAIAEDGHEIAAAGLHTDAIHWGEIDPNLERGYVEETRAAFDKAGLTPTTWMSPARQQSRQTLDLIAQFGFDVCLDWESDQTPLRVQTEHGPVTLCGPHVELEDRLLLVDRKQTEDLWRDQILAAADLLKDEGARLGPRSFGFSVTPWLMGQPFRIGSFAETVSALSGDKRVWLAPAGDIAKAAA